MTTCLAFSQTGSHPRFAEFSQSTTRLIEHLLYKCAELEQTLQPHEAVFVFQQCYESVPLLAFFRQMTDAANGDDFVPHPWRKDHQEVQVRKTGAIMLAKGVIARRIATDLKQLGLKPLATALEQIYSEWPSHVRNAIAHATYSEPTQIGEPWIFSSLQAGEPLGYQTVDFTLSDKEVEDLCSAVVQLRIASSLAIGQIARFTQRRKISFIGEQGRTNQTTFTIDHGSLHYPPGSVNKIEFYSYLDERRGTST